MPRQMIHPTAFPKVNVLLHDLLSGVKSILDDNFVGMYLYETLEFIRYTCERGQKLAMNTDEV